MMFSTTLCMIFGIGVECRGHGALGDARNSLADIAGTARHTIRGQPFRLGLLGDVANDLIGGALDTLKAAGRSFLRSLLQRAARVTKECVFGLEFRQGAGNQSAKQEANTSYKQRILLDG